MGYKTLTKESCEKCGKRRWHWLAVHTKWSSHLFLPSSSQSKRREGGGFILYQSPQRDEVHQVLCSHRQARRPESRLREVILAKSASTAPQSKSSHLS